MAEVDKDSDNFFRLVKLIVDVGSEVLRGVLLHIIKPNTLENVLQTCRPEIVRNRRNWFDNEYKVLTNKHPNSDEFDITLLLKIFRNVCPLICPHVISPNYVWGRSPGPKDIKLEDDIERMREIRNSIFAHAKSTEVTDAEFRVHWAHITDTITRAADHGSPGMKQRVKDKIDTIRTENLKSTSLKNLREVLKAWYEEDRKEFEKQLKQQGDETKAMVSEQVTQLDMKVQGLEEKVGEMEANLPSKSEKQSITDTVSDEDEARPPTSVTTKENLHLDSPQGGLRVNFSKGDVSVNIQSSDKHVELHWSNWEEKEGIRSKIKVEIRTSPEQSRDSFEHDVISQLLNSSDNYMRLRTIVNFLYDRFGAMLHRITGGCIELWIKHATTEQYEEMKKNKYDIEIMLTQSLSKKPNYYTLCIRFQDDVSDSQRPTLGSTTKNAQGFLSSCDVPNDQEVTEGVNYTDNTSTTSKKNTNIPMERLESSVSDDAAPLSPTRSVPLEGTPVCDTTPIGQSDTDTTVGVRQHPLTPSISYPQLNQTSGTQNIIIGNTVRDTQSCENLPSQVNRDGEDDDLNVDYYDVMVLYAEADRSEAITFLHHLQNDIRLKNGESIKAALYDDPDVSGPAGLKFDLLEKAYKRCSYTFVYVTKNTDQDFWFNITQQSCVTRDVDTKTSKVVPVFTKRQDERDFVFPMGLNAHSGINYYANDDVYKKSVSSMVEEGRKTKLLARRKKQINKPCQTDLREGRGHDNVTAELDQLKLAQPKQGLETDCPITACDLSLNLEASTSSTQTSRPGTDQDAPITENHLNHTRLLNALATVSADGLRKMLLSQIPLGYNDFYDLLRKNKHNLGFLSKKQIETLFLDPIDRQSPASVDQYDITLLCALVRNISSVAGPETGWGKKLKDVPTRDTSLGASTERIRVLRNEIIGHHKDYQVDDTTFEGYWKEICQIMDDIEAVIGEQGYKEALRRLREQMFTVSEAMRLRNMFKDDLLDKLEELKDWVKGYPYL